MKPFILGVLALSSAAGAQTPSQVVARLPDRTITLQDVDAAGGRDIYDASQQLYEARVRSLYRMLSNDLLEREARAANSTVQQLLEKKAPTAKDKRAYVASLLEKHGVRISLGLSPAPPTEELRGAMDAVAGNPKAPVTLVVFSDYLCPYCRDSSRTLEQLVEKRPDDVRVVYRHFPTHESSTALAQAALCAGDQGKFLEYHNLLFASPVRPDELKGLAQRLGLDTDKFSSCLDTGVHAARVEADIQEGQRLGIQGTPTLFVNGLRLRGAQSYDRLNAQVEQILRNARPVSLSHAR